MGMGYPDLEDEIEIARGKSVSVETSLQPIMNAGALSLLQGQVEQIHVNDSICTYIAKLMAATRENSYIELGVSPRGTIACVRMAKAWAFLQGRTYVIPEDVSDIFLDIARHRIVLNTKARVTHVTEAAVLEDILSTVRQPASYMEKV